MNSILNSKFNHKTLTFLAPMEGITDSVYRDVAVKHTDLDIICTEFVRLSGDHFKPKQLKDTYKLYENATLSVQLMGENPTLFAQTVPHFLELGVSIIDLNLGCPSPTVNRKGCGVAMLLDWKLLVEVVSSIRKATDGLFSCKMRAGWDNEENAVEISRILENEGIDFLTVHPRTKVQRYKGHSNWDLLAEIKSARTIPIIGNGDIFVPEDAKRMIDHTRVDGIMIGRGILRNPLLYNQVHQFLETGMYDYASSDDYKIFYMDYANAMKAENRHEKAILSKLKEHFSNFHKSLEDGREFWDRLKVIQELDIFLDQMMGEPFELRR